MAIGVHVRLPGRISWSVGVLVVGVVHMRVLVQHLFMHVLVLMPLDQMQGNADRHQQRRA